MKFTRTVPITGETASKLLQLAIDLATATGADEYGGGIVCECHYTMGQVLHACVNCRARGILTELSIEYESPT